LDRGGAAQARRGMGAVSAARHSDRRCGWGQPRSVAR
jgi:hypothetical protein